MYDFRFKFKYHVLRKFNRDWTCVYICICVQKKSYSHSRTVHATKNESFEIDRVVIILINVDLNDKYSCSKSRFSSSSREIRLHRITVQERKLIGMFFYGTAVYD